MRQLIAQWRKGGMMHLSHTSRRLLEYWRDTTREKRLFFCQIDPLGRVVTVTDEKAQRTRYTAYDRMGRVVVTSARTPDQNHHQSGRWGL